MKITHVVSSNINAIGWHRNTLFIRFNSGTSYAYQQVPFAHYQAFVEAESHGQHFHRFIRSQFQYSKLATDPFVTKVTDIGTPTFISLQTGG